MYTSYLYIKGQHAVGSQNTGQTTHTCDWCTIVLKVLGSIRALALFHILPLKLSILVTCGELVAHAASGKTQGQHFKLSPVQQHAFTFLVWSAENTTRESTEGDGYYLSVITSWGLNSTMVLSDGPSERRQYTDTHRECYIPAFTGVRIVR